MTPALCVDAGTLEHNLRRMAEALPGPRLRPHVKAHKSTALARRQAALGHTGFTCATVGEMEGLAKAGLGDDLLLANEVVHPGALARLGRLEARVTVAVDSEETLAAAAAAGIGEVLVDVNVGLPRCGCAPEAAGDLAERARAAGLAVRGVMGYEGHAMVVADPAKRAEITDQAMALLARAHADVGGELVSAGGTCTYAANRRATEIQAGSYALMDTTFTYPDLPFRPAMWVESTVLSVSRDYAVADCGLKSLAMDHGNPTVEGGAVWFCSDEHLTFAPDSPLRVGDRVRVWPTHVDPTVAKHEELLVVEGERVLERWEVDLRGW